MKPQHDYPWPTFNAEERLRSVRTFFSSISSTYDKVHEHSYWAFSDEILLKILKDKVLSRYKTTELHTLLDAGAGTARWTIQILQSLTKTTADLFDISPEMLEVARKNLQESQLESRTQLYEDDVEELAHFKNKTYDIITCFYNVIGFNIDPVKAINNLCNATASNGTLILVIPNLYHAVYFSIQHKRWSEIERIRSTYSVKYTDKNPEVLLFTPEVITSLLIDQGIKDVEIYGFPVSIYPEFRGDSLVGENDLEDQEQWDSLVNNEVHFCLQPEAAARGKNLLVIARK